MFIKDLFYGSLVFGSVALLACVSPSAEILNTEAAAAETGSKERSTDTVTITKVNGQNAYSIEGPYDLRGTLRQVSTDPSKWELDASMLFTTGGYSIDKPRILMTRSIPEQVIMTIVVNAPPPGSMVTMALEEQDISEVIPASTDAIWRMQVVTQRQSEGE